MAIPYDKDDREHKKFVESSTVSGQPIVVVGNADGSNISGGGSSGTQYTQGGATVVNPTGTAEVWFDASGNPKAITPSQPLPSNITDGTNSANVLKDDGTTSAKNALLTAGTVLNSGTVSLSLASPDTPWYDLAYYPWISLTMITNASSNSMQFQTANDASFTNPSSTGMTLANSNAVFATTTTSANGTFIGARSGRYFRIHSTLSGANTASLVLNFFSTTPPYFTNIVAVSGVASVVPSSATNSAIPSAAIPIGLNGSTATPVAVGADGRNVNAWGDRSGRLHTLVDGNARPTTSKAGNASSSGDTTIVTAGTNLLKVHAFSLTTTSTTAVTCKFFSGTAGTEVWRVTLQAVTGASTGANLAVSPPSYLFTTATATALVLNLSAAVSVDWAVSYIDDVA